MFDHFLNHRENRKEWIDKCSITYLGGSFPLAIVLGGLNDGSRPKLHHLGPPFPGSHGNAPFQSQPAHMRPEDLIYLRAKGVFSLPDKTHLDALVSVFLDHVYPLYPIVHRQEFIHHIGSALVARPFCIDLDLAYADILTIEDFVHDAMAPAFSRAPPRIDMDSAGTPNPFSMSLSVQYNSHLISIYFGHMLGEDPYRRDEHEVEGILDSAAHRIPTVVCTLVTKSALLIVPHELNHGIFLAQAAL
ncbi:hypothetical protein BDW42DRAFT_197309 [Aspergillus taichungensis]|uniref:Uncharacterized protein n=1 Tax=Aspergillus taichungensis TaxID=482145 RepID=A0A2J5HHA1_9EURO|nr:hypothetical protein BDW42DRAFT_197309 [Aspergillus taichungensis]